MTDVRKIEMYCRIVCNRLVYRVRLNLINTISAAIEYLDIADYMPYELGFHPDMFNTFDRLPENVQEHIARLWAEENGNG